MYFINWDDVEEREILKGYKAKFVHSDSMTFANWNIEAGHDMPGHYHTHEQISSVLEGEFLLTVEEEVRLLKPGMVAVIPGNATHSGKAITDCKIVDVFSPVRKDYKFE